MNINDILKHINLSTLKENVKSAFNSLINLIEELSSENRRLKEENQRLRDENNRLKGEQGKPDLKADTKKANDISSEKDRESKKSSTKKRKKRSKNKEIKIDRTQTCSIDKGKLPGDAVFKGYKRVIVQDIKLHTDNIEFKKEIYYSPSQKKTYIAALPNGYKGEFGPSIKGLSIILKNICNMSEAKIYEFFKYFGIFISMGKISNILIKDHHHFHQEKTDIVEAGLQTTIYQATDDTKARVNGQNYHTHILGNPYFTAFFTEHKKNRLTVLNVLANGKELTYCLNEHAFSILKQLNMSKKYFKELEKFKSENIFHQHEFEHLISQHFSEFGEQVKSKIAEATAIAAYRKGVDRRVRILLCDDAPQFKLICQMLALCWVHDGRHYKKLSPVYKYNVKKVDTFLNKYWKYYHKLLDYKKSPDTELAEKLSDEFDRLFSTVTGYNELDDRISKTLQKKEHLLLALKYPEIPLHNNDMELGARVCVRKRDVSLHTMTDEGTRANDTFLTIIQTCKKLDVNPFYYIMDRIKGTFNMPPLAQVIKLKHQKMGIASI
jgi:hypothetical protein